MGAAGFFIWIGYRVNRSVQQYNKHTVLLMEDGMNDSHRSDQMEQSAKLEIAHRLRAVKNMTIIIWTVSLTATYVFIYTLVLLAWADA